LAIDLARLLRPERFVFRIQIPHVTVHITPSPVDTHSVEQHSSLSLVGDVPADVISAHLADARQRQPAAKWQG